MGSQLGPGQALTVNQQLQAATRPLRLILQADGNLVLYKDGSQALWATATNGMAATQAVMQADGNFVVRAATKALWSSKTAGHPGAGLVLQDDGNLVVYDTGGHPLWSSGSVTDWPAPAGDRMHATDALYPGVALTATARPLRLVLQTDGNLVLYRSGVPVWASGTNGKPAGVAVMQEDGNFVVYAPAGPLWASGTNGHPGAWLVLQNDGNMVVHDPQGHSLWASGTVIWPPAGPRAILWPPDALTPGQELDAPSQPYKLVLQQDGNLVLYENGLALWATGTNGKTVTQAVMQADGNLVLYGPAGALWATNTAGHPGARLVLQDDGNLVVYDIGRRPLWSSHTVTHQRDLGPVVRARRSCGTGLTPSRSRLAAARAPDCRRSGAHRPRTSDAATSPRR